MWKDTIAYLICAVASIITIFLLASLIERILLWLFVPRGSLEISEEVSGVAEDGYLEGEDDDCTPAAPMNHKRYAGWFE